jgi:hypothetical protein
MKAIGILATILLPPAAVYVGLQWVGPLSPEAVEFARRVVIFFAALLATGVLLVASARETKL